MPRRSDNRLWYSLLAIVFLLAMGYQVCLSFGIVQYRRLYSVEAAWPFGFRGDSDRFDSVERALADAGVQPNDELIQVEGQPYRGPAQVARILAGKKPGDKLNITVLRNGRPQPETFAAPLYPMGSSDLAWLGWIVMVSMTIVTPMFCLLLGFFVAAIRPRDPLAWLLLAMMLSFAQLSAVSGNVQNVILQWPDILRPAAIFYHTSFASSWSIWILVFGVYFPERLPMDARWPWVKWLVIAPIAVAALGNALSSAGSSEDFRLFTSLRALLRPFDQANMLVQMAAISCFFFSLGTKIGTASSSDSGRRLKLLINGTGVAFTPLFFLAVYGLIRGFENIPDKYLAASFLPLALFPVTLAYVIVVQRALDVRVVIRQGLRYALAQRTVRVLQIAAFAAVIIGTATLATDSSSSNRPRKIQAIALGVIGLLFISRGSDKLRGLLDRRFFREAYDAERILRELSDQVRTMVETGPLLETVAKQISESLHVPRVAMLVNHDWALWLGFRAWF